MWGNIFIFFFFLKTTSIKYEFLVSMERCVLKSSPALVTTTKLSCRQNYGPLGKVQFLIFLTVLWIFSTFLENEPLKSDIESTMREEVVGSSSASVEFNNSFMPEVIAL